MFALATVLAGGVAGCDSSTMLVVTVDVRDTSVPYFTQLAIKISSVSDPSRQVSQKFISTAPGYGAEGGLPPVAIPLQETFNLDSYLSGEVLVEVQGLEIYSGAVLAAGSATANVVPKQTTNVTVTLHGLGSCGSPGGDGGAVDASAPCDAGAGGG
jgi:hypothetical protein